MNSKHIFVFLVIIISIQFLAHFVVYEGVSLVFGSYSGVWIPVSEFLLGFLTFAFIALILIVSKYNNFLTRFLYRTFAVWQGFLLYFFLASTVSILALSVGFEVQNKYGTGIFALAFLTGVYGVINAKNIKVKKISVTLKNLPEIWKVKKVVWISDVHLGQVNAEGFLKKVVSKINTLNPDLVLIGGDLYDGVKVDTNKIIEPLRDLKTVSGTYFITGNHDGFTDASTIEDIKAIQSVGIKVLQDTLVEIDGVQMIGIDYKHSNPRDNFRQRLAELNIKKEMPALLLKHIPSDVDIARDAGIDFQLSGHTHRAQMWPLSYLPKIIFKGFDYGLKKTGDTQIYTSSGVGTWGPPLRVGSNSEIVLINFK
jgi:predicted MPP superfamily phosphohydrolase